nr:hypothetical protein Iba_chr04aCG19060 [Ipomoea batatas]
MTKQLELTDPIYADPLTDPIYLENYKAAEFGNLIPVGVATVQKELHFQKKIIRTGKTNHQHQILFRQSVKVPRIHLPVQKEEKKPSPFPTELAQSLALQNPFSNKASLSQHADPIQCI